jgi:hypothetical protein
MQAKNGDAYSRLRQGEPHYAAKHATPARNDGSRASYVKERLEVQVYHVGFSPGDFVYPLFLFYLTTKMRLPTII